MVRFATLTRLAGVVTVSAVIAACGGGDDNNTDTTPDSFSFEAETSVERDTTLTSDPIVITGINSNANITISNGSYSIDGGNFTTAAGTISEGQTLTLRMETPAEFSTTATATVTVGGVTASYTATTLDQDLSPEVFTFTALTNQNQSSPLESNSITVTDINDATPISITGGEYKIGEGDYTSAAGTVIEGNVVTVRLTSSASFSTETVASLTVGDQAADFSVTTLAQDISPAAFSFTALTNQSRNVPLESGEITISDVNDVTPISIENGEYKIGDGEYTSDAGTVINGQMVMVRLTSSAQFSTAVTATLTVGDQNAGFTATTLAQDTSPTPFSFTALVDQPRIIFTESNTITISDINDAAPISVEASDELLAFYRINDGDFTEHAGTVNDGDTVTVRLATSSEFSTSRSATLTVGDQDATYTVTTEEDYIPDALAFTDVTDADRGEEVTVGPFTITGFEIDSVRASITGGTFSTAGETGPFSADAFDAINGQQIWVRTTASSDFAGEVNVTVDLEGNLIASTLTVTTVDDTTAPEAEVIFPTKVGLTDAANITVRGVASDDFDVTSVQVNGEDVTDTSDAGDFSTWEIVVALTAGENEIVVSAEDGNSNIAETADSITVTRGSTDSNFPSDEEIIVGNSSEVVLDKSNNRLLWVQERRFEDGVYVVAIDLDTGVRSLIFELEEAASATDFSLALDSNNGMYMANSASGEFWLVNLMDDTRSLVTSNSLHDTGFPVTSGVSDIEYDSSSSNLFYIHNESEVVRINTETWERALVDDGFSGAVKIKLSVSGSNNLYVGTSNKIYQISNIYDSPMTAPIEESVLGLSNVADISLYGESSLIIYANFNMLEMNLENGVLSDFFVTDSEKVGRPVYDAEEQLIYIVLHRNSGSRVVVVDDVSKINVFLLWLSVDVPV